MGDLIDIHNHLLPGVDDGCIDVNESLELAAAMVEAGFSDVLCTPHIAPRLQHNNPREIVRGVSELQELLDLANVPLRVHAGGENRVGAENIALPIRKLNLAASGHSRGGRFFLFDNWNTEWPHELTPMLKRLTADGITPILGHPERIPWVWDDPLATADRLSRLGCQLQLNAYVLTGPWHKPPVKVQAIMTETAKLLLENGRYDYAATDAHRPGAWPERREGLVALRELAGEAEFLRLFRDNPQQLLPPAHS